VKKICLVTILLSGLIDSNYASAICSLSSKQDSCPAPGTEEQRISTGGAVFSRDTSNSALGEAYRDPSGLIWGDVVRTNGKITYMSQYDAEDYCKASGARLPTNKEFRQLRIYLSRGIAQGYRPYLPEDKANVLPGLSSDQFWAWTEPTASILGYGFDGVNGNIIVHVRNHFLAVRCVAIR
jgi:hypothetical protein